MAAGAIEVTGEGGGCSRGLALITPFPHLVVVGLLWDSAVHTPCSTTILSCGSSMLRRGRPGERERDENGLIKYSLSGGTHRNLDFSISFVGNDLWASLVIKRHYY